MAKVLLYSEAPEKAKELLTAARVLGEAVALTINDDAAAQALAACGVKVLAFSDAAVLSADTAAIAKVVASAVEQSAADVVLLASDRRGKELAGRVAARLQAGCLTDVKSLEIVDGAIQCQRNAFGGAVIATESIDSPKKVIAITAAAFEQAGSDAPGVVTGFVTSVSPTVKVLSSKTKDGDTVDLSAAKVIIAVGQGVEDQSSLAAVQELAQALDGVVACTKPVATDKKWLSEDRIIGLSGETVKPDLAILIGISGQVQFTVGIREAKTIISINTDEKADIVKMSDYYYVADALDAVAALKAKLV
jgi:electron transfer flavoprotein alpha subunit